MPRRDADLKMNDIGTMDGGLMFYKVIWEVTIPGFLK